MEEAQNNIYNGEIAYQLHGNCYLNITNKCHLRCQFCPKFNGTWEVQGYPLRLKREPVAAEILHAVGDPAQYKEVVFCGLGEPTCRWYTLVSLARELKRRGARRIRLNTDGLANLALDRNVTSDLENDFDAVCVSLNAHNPIVYAQQCRPKWPGAWRAAQTFLRQCRDYVPEVTATAINGLPGVDIDECRNIAQRLGVGFRQRELDKVG